MMIASACLMGVNCRYDGGSSGNEEVLRLAAEGKVVPVCPEQLGGCPTPRPAVEIQGGTGADVLLGCCEVAEKNGKIVTKDFIKGAEEVLKIADRMGCKKAILKSRSPSCGYGSIYDGKFCGALRSGNGITAELLVRNGIEVISEEDTAKLKTL